MASPSPSEETTLLAQVLKPLLDDFQYWFNRSLAFLEQETIIGLTKDQQTDLLGRVTAALAETQTAAALLAATDGQAGVEAAKVMNWHALVAECWAAARRHRAGAAE
ncbi:MAG: DUF2605 domain-containing protein [Leptolyngbyaceae cyanobacterium SM2_5_2]|nr:DUF2605 domain-containing protein [Leptolyngbyaceae cyanobacterium SM2_5_2]